MSLVLKSVAPAQGLRWLRDGFRLFLRHPLAFCGMFAAFLFAVLLCSLVPVVGPLITLAGLPLLSLGFMVAGESALSGGAVHPGHFLAPLKRSPAHRRSQLVLCGLYGLSTLLIMLLADLVDRGAFDKLQLLLARNAPQAEIDALVADPGFASGMFVRFALATLVSVPFWHASALVHWGGQKPAQALFSSTLAVWRCKGAFAVYSLAWTALVLVGGMATALVLGALGQAGAAGMVALPAALMLSTVFYVSLLFTFNDSFGGSHGIAPPAAPTAPDGPDTGAAA